MINSARALLAFTFLIGLSSCETDININDEWEDVTVIYGLLDVTADTNWVRVERAYLGPAPANESFGEPDSLYYDTIVVSLESFQLNSDNSRGARVDSIILIKDTESRELNPGVFTTEGYRLYRTTSPLNEDFLYELTVKKPGTDHPDAKGNTILVSGKTSDPRSFGLKNPRDAFPAIPLFNGTIEWWASDNAQIYEIDIYFHYTEYDIATKSKTPKMLKMDYETLTGPSAQAVLQEVNSNLSLTNFYQQLSGSLKPAPGTLRFYDKMRIEIWAGGEDLATYIQLNEPTTGVGQNRPEFPQIENGTGLFSSRTQVALDNIQLSPTISDKYYLSPILCDLGFAVAEASDTCYCVSTPGIGEEKECF